MKIVLLSDKDGYQYILTSSSIGEVERIRERLDIKDFEYVLREPEYRIRHNLIIKDIIAYGKIDEISEAECRRYFPKGSATLSPGQRYKTVIPNDLKYDMHFDARSAWNGAIMMLCYPDLAILYRKVIPTEYGS